MTGVQRGSVAVVGAAGFSVYQEIRWIRSRKRLKALGLF